jgi:hypothetical protein
MPEELRINLSIVPYLKNVRVIFNPPEEYAKLYAKIYSSFASPGEEFLYQGEILNMEGHGTFLSMGGKTFRLHLENFWFVLDYVSTQTTTKTNGSKIVSVSKFISTEE